MKFSATNHKVCHYIIITLLSFNHWNNILGDLTKALKEILKCFPFPIDLESLARAEQILMNQMDVVSFSSFQHGSFLQFLANSNELLKCIGGKCIGGSSSRGAKSRRTQIISCISQIKDRSNLVRERTLYDHVHVHV